MNEKEYTCIVPACVYKEGTLAVVYSVLFL